MDRNRISRTAILVEMAGVNHSGDADFLVQYLLGELPVEDVAKVERSLFEQPELVESLRKAEQELIRDELAGALPSQRHVRFHEYFLSFPHLRAQYESIKSLRDAVGPPHSQS